MLAQPETQLKSVFKNPFLYSWTALAIVVLVVGWILFSRWQENRTIEKHAKEERTLKQQEQDRIAVEQLGGKELAIQNPFNCVTAWPTPNRSNWNLSPIPSGPPIPGASM